MVYTDFLTILTFFAVVILSVVIIFAGVKRTLELRKNIQFR